MKRQLSSLDFLKYAGEPVAYKTGDIIFREGDPGDSMYVVKSGEVSIFVNFKKIETIPKGAILGEMALIDNTPRSATAVAAVDSELVHVDAKKFIYMVQQTPYFALDVLRVMANRLRAMNSSVTSIMIKNQEIQG